MKNYKFYLLIIIVIMLGSSAIAQQRIPKKNIERFTLSVYTKTTEVGDSINAFVFMHIPYFTLQYVKTDSQFIANYEAVIALQGKKGKQIGREVWRDSIVVEDYNKTNSNTDVKILMKSFKIPNGKYKVMVSLLDLDTKRLGETTLKLEISNYNKKQYLNPPILLDEINGKWGFGDNRIPAIRSSSFKTDSGLTVILTGKVKPGEYILNTKFIANDDTVLLDKNINENSQTGVFEHYITLSKDLIQGIGIEVKTTLTQNKFTSEKSTDIVVQKVGISYLISDINEALKQMRYILDSNERSKVKKTLSKNKEKLFIELWNRRDPTPDSDINELMNEYYKRVVYSNVHFDSYVDGWETDMGMIYIIFGTPDDVERTIMPQMQNAAEIWYYYDIQKSFTFIDSDGFGHYRLTTPYLGYRR